MSILDKFFGDDASRPHKGRGAVPPYCAPIERGDYATALPMLHSAIAKGDATAMGLLGFLTGQGYGVEKDLEEAAVWLRQAAVRGHAASQSALGMSLALGLGTPINLREAAHWLYQAAKGENFQALEVLVAILTRDRTVSDGQFREQDVAKLAYQLALDGRPESQFAWGICLAHGIGTPADLQKATYWLYEATKADHPDALLALGDIVDRDRSLLGLHFEEHELNTRLYQLKKTLSATAGRTR